MPGASFCHQFWDAELEVSQVSSPRSEAHRYEHRSDRKDISGASCPLTITRLQHSEPAERRVQRRLLAAQVLKSTSSFH
jgi:hypothetical protein